LYISSVSAITFFFGAAFVIIFFISQNLEVMRKGQSKVSHLQIN